MVNLLLLSLLTPFILLDVGKLVPAMTNDSADVAMIMFHGAADFLTRREFRSKYHESVAWTGNAITRTETRWGWINE